MSGHSKWSTIKRQKGVADAKRGQQFTKASNAITIAVRQGGGITDPNFNFKLRLAIDKAREVNMPKENIDRAIKRAEGKDAASVEENVYEGFGPGGVSMIVETVTDNKQRTFAEVRNIFSKNGGTLGEPGAVAYLFDKVGEIVIEKNGKPFDELFDLGLESGVEDVEDEEGSIYFYTDPGTLFEVKSALEEKGVFVASSEVVFRPKTYITLDEPAQEKVLILIDKLEELDDVQKVHHNMG